MESWLTSPDVWFYSQGSGECECVSEWRKGRVLAAQWQRVSERVSEGVGSERYASFHILALDDEDASEGVSERVSEGVREEVRLTTRVSGSGEFELVKRRDSSLAHSLTQLSDLTRLTHLNEPELLHCIHLRYSLTHSLDSVYSHTGPMLLAVNPLRQLGLYTTHSLDAYSEESLGLRSAELPPLPPHVYRTSARAYRGMFLDKYSPDQREDQAILVNGESGAGYVTHSLTHSLTRIHTSSTPTMLLLHAPTHSLTHSLNAGIRSHQALLVLPHSFLHTHSLTHTLSNHSLAMKQCQEDRVHQALLALPRSSELPHRYLTGPLLREQ
jgi:hypothetical protein